MRVAGAPDLISSYNRAEMSLLKRRKLTFWGCFTGGRPSVPKPPVSRWLFLPENQQEVALRPISTRSWETAACKLPVLNNTLNLQHRQQRDVNKIWVCICRKIKNSSPKKFKLCHKFHSEISVIIQSLYDLLSWDTTKILWTKTAP